MSIASFQSVLSRNLPTNDWLVISVRQPSDELTPDANTLREFSTAFEGLLYEHVRPLRTQSDSLAP